MWELMRIGIEMQERMIEVHAQGLKLTGDMLREAEWKIDPQAAALEANRAREVFVDHWFDLWSWRI